MDGCYAVKREGNVMTTNSPWVIESPVQMVEGDSYTFNLTIPGSPTITGTPTVKIYNEETDTTATNLSGAASASGSVVTTGTVQTVKGGETYTMAITVVVDGRTKVYLCLLNVLHPWGTT